MREWVSIEHQAWWGTKMGEAVQQSGLGDRVTVHVVPPDDPHYGLEDGTEQQFWSYINFAQSLNKKFDLVIDDGRARLAVRWTALNSYISKKKLENVAFFQGFPFKHILSIMPCMYQNIKNPDQSIQKNDDITKFNI